MKYFNRVCFENTFYETITKLIICLFKRQSADGCVYHQLNNDVGLLKLAKPVMLNDHVNTICLPPQGQNVPVATRCYITGKMLNNFQ